MSELKGVAKKFFFEKFQMPESVFCDAVRLILRRQGVKLFNLQELTEEQEATLIQVFHSLSKDELEKLVKKDATVNIIDCILE